MKPYNPGIGLGGGRALIECLAPTNSGVVTVGCCFVSNAWRDRALDCANQHDMRHGKLSSTLYIVTAGAHATYKYVNRS